MEIKELAIDAKRDFNNAICLIGVIPSLTFVYLLYNKLPTLEIFVGRAGYIALIIMVIFIAGILLGRKMLWKLILKLLDFNQKILSMQEELIAKNKLAAITETVLTLGHEINNPLLVIRGNLEIIGSEINQIAVHPDLKERLSVIKINFDRIGEVTEKLSHLSQPVIDTVYGDSKIINLSKSR
jgi:signal transduction histidine kinase